MHYHVTMGTGNAVIACATFEDSSDTAAAFIDLTFGMFSKALPDRVELEKELKFQMEETEQEGAYVEGGPIKIMWLHCDCKSIASMN